MSISLIAAAALLAQAPPADGTRWEAIGEEGAVSMSLDPASIARSGDKVRLRLRGERREAADDGSLWGILEVEFDCAARTGSLISLRSHGADGRLIEEVVTQEGNRRTGPLRPESAADRAIFRRGCGADLPAGQ